jgi:hydroxymethylglutaryl-CoA lyase
VDNRVDIVEVGARDGLQNESAVLPTADKIELINRLIAAGVRRIEAASFVNPKRVPQMADGEAVLAGLEKRADVSYIGLVLNRKGFERAAAAGCDEIGLVAVATDSFGVKNQGANIEQSIAACEEIAPLARAAGLRVQITVSVAFGCPYEGEVPVARVVDVVRRLARLEPMELALADTIGVAAPAQVLQVVTRVGEAAPRLRLRGHFHNTRNTALANIFAAYTAGVRTFDCSVGGIGGCPFAPKAGGNVASEDVVYMLERSGIATGIRLPELIAISHWLEPRLGHAMPSALSRAGLFPSPVA